MYRYFSSLPDTCDVAVLRPAHLNAGTTAALLVAATVAGSFSGGWLGAGVGLLAGLAVLAVWRGLAWLRMEPSGLAVREAGRTRRFAWSDVGHFREEGDAVRFDRVGPDGEPTGDAPAPIRGAFGLEPGQLAVVLEAWAKRYSPRKKRVGAAAPSAKPAESA